MSVDAAAESGTTVRSPDSQGEHLLRSAYGTAERAGRFYRDQVYNQLLPTMVPTRSIGATVCWPAWATSARTRTSGC
jgi:hypothetical protein